MKEYYNEKENKVYYEGRSLTFMLDGVLHSGIPTEEQLEKLGYVLREQPKPKEISEEEKEQQVRLRRMAEIKQELDNTDYLDHKANDGEDITEANEKYGGDWRAYRCRLRAEYRKLRAEYNELEELSL